MFNKKMSTLTKMVFASAVLLTCCALNAQQVLPNNIETERVQDAIAQTNGVFDSVNMDYIQSLGMQQKAWNNPMDHMGEGQTKPGYSRYSWSPDIILPIRIREGMMTLINLPTWELIEKVHIGSPESFGGEIAASNSLLLYADPSYLGVDSNMIIFGRSGNRYVFYLRSETYNTAKITQSVVDVLVPPRYTPVENGGLLQNNTGFSNRAAGNSMNSMQNGNGTISGRNGGDSADIKGRSAGQNPIIPNNSNEWLQTIPVDPESIRFDIDMYLPNPSDIDIAPDNVWRDNVFTYIDLGPKALTMTQRPVVSLIVQDSEVPIGFRSRGPNSRLIVVEAIGDLVLRNGQKIVCLKLRRDPASGLEYTDYTANNSASFSSQAIKPSVIAQQPQQTAQQTAQAQYIPQNNQAPYMPQYAMPQYAPTQYAPQMQAPAVQYSNVSYTPAATPTYDMYTDTYIDSTMAPMYQNQNPYTTYMDVAASTPPASPRAITGKEVIAVELGKDADVAVLEQIWDRVYNQNARVLKGFTPYYSLDTSADGNVKELFRLRIGPMSSVKAADALCEKLARRGQACAIVSTQ